MLFRLFVVRINDTSGSLRSLVVALNDAGYNTLVSLIMNGINVLKSAFKYDIPKPYNKWTWPSGDVYPTWFNDTLVNVGLVGKKSYVDLVVSVTFSEPTGVRMHFDAYGKTVSYSPPSDGYITHKPLSENSTVLFQTGPPPQRSPSASFTFTPTYQEVNEVVTFNASRSYDPDGYIVEHAWNFGEGIITSISVPIITHAYAMYVTYTVTLNVTDSEGGWDTESFRPNGTSWTFTPTATGVYHVYLNVTDANNNTAQSGTARIVVSSVPVGGYAISFARETSALTFQTAVYITLIVLFGLVLSLTKRKRNNLSTFLLLLKIR